MGTDYAEPDMESGGYLMLNKQLRAVIDQLKESPEYQVAVAQSKLAASDYKVLKCVEAMLVDEKMPYDVSQLYAERQGVREEINVIQEEKLNSVGGIGVKK